MLETAHLEGELRALFEEELGLSPPTNDTDLFESGIMDSLTFVNMLVSIERKFGLVVKLEALELDNFRTLDGIVRFVAHNRRTAGYTAEGDHVKDQCATG